MAKYGDTNGKKLGSEKGRQRIAERRERLKGVVGSAAGTSAEPSVSGQNAEALAPKSESGEPKKPASRAK
jgi:hypothetical protein